MKLKKVFTGFVAAAMICSGTVCATNENHIIYNVPVSAAEALATSSNLNETAYITWAPISGADGYNVYVKAQGGSYTQLDSMLIRQYSGYFRADAVGLAAGNYVMKVVPTSNGTEDTSKAIESGAIAVKAHDRSGYAFANGKDLGAYNADGTLKDNAQVIYVTDENKDTVTAEVDSTGKGATTVTGVQNIITAFKKGKETRPMAIRFIGNITDPGDMDKGDLMLDTVTAGMTIEGIGNDATFNGFGLVLKNCSNVEVRNIGFMNCNSSEGDDCGLQQGNTYCWVHNCDFFYGDAGSDSDQAKGDGALDTKKSQYITHSYNHFFDNGKCNLQGANSSDTSNYITYHHNWYDHSDSRHPRVRVATVHVYNNYYDGNAKYGIGSTTDSDIFVENNYFRNCNKPMIISEQGSDTEGTLSSETGGMIKAYGNVIEGAKSYIPYSENNTDFDCYDASSKTEQVPSSVKASNGGATYSNFDTASDMYTYSLDAASDVPAIIEANAGRVDGGDFKWEFDDSVDDAAYDVNTELKAALVAYDDSIIAIGSGFTNTSGNDTPAVTTAAPSVTTTTTTTKAVVSTNAPAATTAPSGEEDTPSGVNILGAGGWNEMMYLVASGVSDADVTAVSYSGPTTGSLTGDDLKYLVRDVDGGVRVDVTGLKAGTYSLTLKTSKGDITKSGIVVGTQDRSGYAHFNYTNGVGAYNDDGTLKENAIVLYVTNDTKDTVTVTSKDGTSVTGIGHILNSAGQDIGSGVTGKGGIPNNNADIIEKLGKDGTPLVVRIIGDVTAPDGLTEFDSVNYGGSEGDNGFMARMQSGKDVTIEGIGTDACINGWGIHFIAETSNPDLGESFEVRNIAFKNVPEDCVGMEGVQESSTLTAPVERCWIHNCEFYKPTIANPAESDKDGGDGACDFKRGLYFTNSYCYYEGYHKTNLVGASDSNLQYHLTYHHNYWKSCESRGPLARQANIHMYNNVFDGQTSYCMNPRADAYIFSEYNLFKDSKNPMQIKQGAIKSYNDVFENVKGDQDGTIVTDKSTVVSSANKYASFELDSSISYIPSNSYKLNTDVSSLKSEFETDGGCMDEMVISSGEVIITTATTTNGNGETTTTTKTTVVNPTGTSPVAPAGGYVHNFTVNSLDSTFYTISGNLSTSKGTVSYAGLTLTQCLKMESATNIAFTASGKGTLTLVFVETAATVKVDGTKYTSSGDGVITVDLAAGAHTITKADSANLFYMAWTEDGAAVTTVTTVTTAQPTTTTTKAVSTTAKPVETTQPTETTQAPTIEIGTPSLLGDVDCSDAVDVADLTMLAKHILNKNIFPLPSDVATANSDVNKDKKIDSADTAKLVEFILEKITSF